MKKRTYIIHGYQGTPEHGWALWLRNALREEGFEAEAPQMPNANHPRMNEWVATIAELAGDVDENTYFVGHSLGVIAVLRYIEQLEPETHIGGTVLVAGFTSDLGIADLSNFYETPIAWDSIRQHGGQYVAIHSDNDPWVSTHYTAFFEKELGADIIMKPGMKHFSGMDGVNELPDARDAVLHIAA